MKTWKFDKSKSHIENFKDFSEYNQLIENDNVDSMDYTDNFTHSKLPEIKLTKWSIQISRSLAEHLKEFCKLKGYTMSGFVEGAIINRMSGSL